MKAYGVNSDGMIVRWYAIMRTGHVEGTVLPNGITIRVPVNQQSASAGDVLKQYNTTTRRAEPRVVEIPVEEEPELTEREALNEAGHIGWGSLRGWSVQLDEDSVYHTVAERDKGQVFLLRQGEFLYIEFAYNPDNRTVGQLTTFATNIRYGALYTKSVPQFYANSANIANPPSSPASWIDPADGSEKALDDLIIRTGNYFIPESVREHTGAWIDTLQGTIDATTKVWTPVSPTPPADDTEDDADTS